MTSVRMGFIGKILPTSVNRVGWNFVAVTNVAFTLMSHCSELLMLMSHFYKMSHLLLMSYCSKKGHDVAYSVDVAL